MEPAAFDQQGLTDFIKAAFTGANGFVFIGLNIIALVGYRRHHVWAFWLAAVLAAFVGGLSALMETQAHIGITNPVPLTHAVLTGMIVAGESSLVIGYALILTVARLALKRIERVLPVGNGNGDADEKSLKPRPPPPAASS